jgi:pilus assembly protein CpaF
VGPRMTNADHAWSDDAVLEAAPAVRSVGAPSPSRSAVAARRSRAGADDAAELAEQVRLRVRDIGVDPQRDAAAVRRIAESVAQAHDERSLTGAVEPLDDLPGLVDDLVARVSGFGPLQRYLDDPTVEEVWINEPSRVFIARQGRHELTPTILTGDDVRELVERMLKASGRRLDLSQPFVDAWLPGGHRLHVVLEGISRDFVAVNIRKFVARAHNLEDLIALGTLDTRAAAFLRAAVTAGLNVVVSGGTQAGKTTLLNCLAAAIPGADRVVSAEEVFELRFAHPDWVAMQTRQAGLEGTGEIRLRELVKQALRMRPSRIIVGEVRAEECLDLLLALNAGLPGMASIHANSAREALVKMCTLPLLAGENIGSRFVVPTVAASVDLVVHIAIDADGVRQVEEIVAVPGRVENDLIETESMFVRRDGRLHRLSGMPPRPERFARRGIDLRRLLSAEPADGVDDRSMANDAGGPS